MEASVALPISEPLPISDDPSPEVPVSDSGDFAPGTVLGGSYRLVRRLGRGGMGDIHLASHERLPGHFVVKVLSPDLVSDQDAFVRFRQEAVVMANIRHPNVVQLVDFNFTMAGLPFLVMEYLPGKDLADILTTRPFLAATQVSSIVRQAACALDAAHKLGIVHRDLKPENIMVVPCEGQGDLIKVIDFGISKARRFNHVTSASMVMGTPEFMSPEQAQGRQEEVDARSDQFALAVISYLLLTGRTPWGGTAPVEILHRVVNNEPLPLTHDGSWPSVEGVLFRAMSKAPHERYPSTLAFWRALDRAMVSDGLLPVSAGGHATVVHGPGLGTPSGTASSQTTEPASNGDGRAPAPGRAQDAFGVPRFLDDRDVSDATHGANPGRAKGAIRPVMLDSVAGDSITANGSVPLAEHASAPASLLGEGVESPEFSLGSADDRHERSITTPMSRSSKRKQPARGKHVWQAVILLVVLASGAYLGLQDVPTVRARAGGGWNALRTFAARAAERGRSESNRLFSRSPKGRGKLVKALAIDTER